MAPKPRGTRARDARVLSCIKSNGLTTIPELMHMTGFSRRTLYSAVKRLEAAGQLKTGMKMSDARFRLFEAIESTGQTNE
ncbi:MAG: winged helix-turn-helix transcriptional regulator [Thermoplasmatota archaeon]